MYHLKSTTLIRVAALALVVSAVGCKKKEAPAVDTTAAIPAAPMPVALHVASVTTGKGLNADKTVTSDATEFGARDTVYVSVKTEGAGTGKLSAKFTYQDGQVVQEMSQDIAPTTDAVSEFHIQKKTAWPKGNYKVEVMLDGASAGSKDYTVK